MNNPTKMKRAEISHYRKIILTVVAIPLDMCYNFDRGLYNAWPFVMFYVENSI